MKYVKSMPKADTGQTEKLKKDGWKKLKEPRTVLRASLLSLPLSILLGGITIGYAVWLKPELLDIFMQDTIVLSFDLKFILMVPLYFVYMFIHEMLHAVCTPNVLKSDKTVWGLNGLFGFVVTEEKMSRKRFMLVSVMPFLVLSLVSLTVCRFLNVLNGYVLVFSVLNAMGSCVDFFNLLLIMVQVGRRQQIVNVGMETYFK